MRAVIMAGGTGGHVYPALAVAQVLRDAGTEILWVGTASGFEAKVVPAAGYATAWIDVAGVRGKSRIQQLLAPLAVIRAVWQAWRIIRRFRPRLALGLGGYASGPGGLAAWLTGVPLLIHEQNARAGTTNRILARLARRVLQAYPNTFDAGARVETVGNPVREDIAAVADAVSAAGRACRILVLGGSQGALALNTQVPQALAQLPTAAIEVRHQAGRTLAAAEVAYLERGLDAEVTDFIDDMAGAYAWADLVICRAGALTCAEVAAAGRPAVLVPFPYAIDDHQTRNAEFLVEAGAALLMPESSLTPQALAEALRPLVEADEQRLAMAAAARRCARPQATAQIAAVCLSYLEAAA